MPNLRRSVEDHFFGRTRNQLTASDREYKSDDEKGEKPRL